ERGKTVAGSAFNPAPVTALLSQRAIQLAGGSLPHENRQLYISMKKFYSSALIGFLLLFAFQGVRGQTTIEFNDVDGGGYGLSYSEGGFSFSINDPGNGRRISSQLTGGFGNSKCLWDNNPDPGAITRW